MKPIGLVAAAMIALSALNAQAGGAREPTMSPYLIADGALSSSPALLIPLLGLLIVAAAVSN